MLPLGMGLLVLGSLLLASQGIERVPPTPFDRAVELELTEEGEALIEGREPCQVVEYEVEFSGTLHVWARSELDGFLRVEDAAEMRVLAEDDDSGGGETPYLELPVEPGQYLAIFVAADGVGPVELRIAASPETDLTRAAAAAASQARAEAQRLRSAGDHAGAREHLSEVAEQLANLAGADTSLRVTFARDELATSLSQLGEPAVERALLERVLADRERTLPEDHPETLRARNNLANSLFSTGDLAGARALRESVLAARQRTLQEDHPEISSARSNLAISLEAMGDLAGARALDEVVLETYERTLPEDHPLLLKARSNFAISLFSMGDLAGARALFERVLAGYERTLPEDHLELLRARSSLAVSLSAMGDLAGARALEEAVLEAYERTLPEDHPDLLLARGNLAVSLHAMGDLAGARALEEAVLEARERTLPEDHPKISGARANLARSLQAMGDLAGTRALLEAALESYERTFPEDHPEILSARSNLAHSLHDMGDLAGARALREAVLEAYERTLPEDHPETLRARNNLAKSLFSTGDLAGARALREAVLEAYERTLQEDHPKILSARSNLALSLYDAGDLAGLRAQALALAVGMQRRVLASVVLAPREARQTVVSEGLRLADLFFWAETASPAAAAAASDPSALRRVVFELAETMRLVAGESARSLARFAADPELAPVLREAARVRAELNDLVVAAGRGALDAGALSAELTRLSRERDRLEREAAGRLAERGVVARAVQARALAAALAPGEVAVGYRRIARGFQDEATGLIEVVDHLLAHVLRPDGSLVRLDLGPAADLEDLGRAWRAALGAPLLRGVALEPEGEDAEASAGRLLRARLLDPILERAGPQVERLFVCADDLVYLVPLAALPLDSEGRDRVGDRLQIVNEVSFARLLAKGDATMGTSTPGTPSLLALGGVAFDAAVEDSIKLDAASPPITIDADAPETRSGMPKRFHRLVQTRLEASTLGDLFEAAFDTDGTVLDGEDASKAALFAAAPGKRYVHLATHGWFAPESVKSSADVDAGSFAHMDLAERVTGLAPMTLCGLALAGANRGRTSTGRVPGILTAEELCSLDLSQCELTVLSACETNVGIRRAGQGIQSLQAALYAAGARTSITSLWKVDDAATRTLMEHFYTNLWLEKMSKAEALWRAKTALREAGHPVRDWAAWVLTGDPD